MKKILVAAFAGLACLFTSCNETAESAKSSNESGLAQKNLAANSLIMKAFQTGDTSGIDGVVSPDFIDHTDRGDMKGTDSLKAMIKWAQTNMKDMKAETIRDLADDEYVFSWVRYTGTSDGSMGMPAGPYDMKSMEISKYKDGKAIEHWAYMDAREVMKMMAAQPATTLKDTSAKK